MLPELQHVGFTRNEANVYFAAIKLGACSVQQLANATGLNRVTVHSICEKLERLQIVHSRYEGIHRKIVPVDPSCLNNLLKQEEGVLAGKLGALSSIMPTLREMYRRRQRAMQVTTYQGEKGYEKMCDDILQARLPILEYANIDALLAVIGPFVAKDYLPRKHKLQIPTRFLYVDTQSARDYIQVNYILKEGAAPMAAKFIDASAFAMDSFFVLYGDKLAIFTPTTLDGVIIQDRSITEAFRPFYSYVWDRTGEEISNTAWHILTTTQQDNTSGG